jgi:hypothetical protein
VAGYEALRRQVTERLPEAWRLGHGLLANRGMAAWLDAYATFAPPAAPAPRDDAAIHSSGGRLERAPTTSSDIVTVLAQMVLLRV